MLHYAANRSASSRLLRVAGRLLLCIALALIPVSGASAAHIDITVSTHHGHGGQDGAPLTSDPAPLCHQLGACAAFLAPTAPDLAHDRGAPPAALPAAQEPASVAQPRRLRPPIAPARA